MTQSITAMIACLSFVAYAGVDGLSSVEISHNDPINFEPAPIPPFEAYSDYICRPKPNNTYSIDPSTTIYINLRHRMAVISAPNWSGMYFPENPSVLLFPNSLFVSTDEKLKYSTIFFALMIGGFPWATYSLSGVQWKFTCNSIPPVEHNHHELPPLPNCEDIGMTGPPCIPKEKEAGR